ncbi:von Willebrand factor A domain-containing protein 7-like [Astyanax mexicanus]|uniref:von Willebrand factor A domain-containing protein 7-like n=1 Tax=Astyanax mexicanus TaxID=7994 RepID=A0A8T2LRJ3_ASTMX|nr:von Willebrand factor A domain-containing protein 7-like [Astyanax mexicanus]
MEYPLLFLSALIGWSLAFMPSLPPDGESLTHSVMTMEALLEVASTACREEAQANGQTYTRPDPLTPQNLLLACLGASEEAGISSSKFTEVLDEIISQNTNIDDLNGLGGSPAHHFNDEVLEQGRDIITEGVSVIKASLGQDDFETARRALGAVTHTLQFLLLSDATTPTCNDCQERECPNVILPEILSRKTLTSGYVSPTPQGKCNHGDDTRGGINKDMSGGKVGPDGTDPHLAAYFTATQATNYLLQDIRTAFGNANFLRLLGITRSSVVCFVIDTTGSMRDDIAQVRKLTANIINNNVGTPDEPSLYILVEFNDPDVKAPVSTTDPEKMLQMVNSIIVGGGGDIPEYSLTGIKFALTAAPPSSKIFVFTDAPAKDFELNGTVTSLAQSKQTQISFLLTNALNSVRRRRRRSAVTNPSNSLYQQLAQSSGGTAIEVTKATISQATKIIEDSVTSSQVRSVHNTLTWLRYTLLTQGRTWLPSDNSAVSVGGGCCVSVVQTVSLGVKADVSSPVGTEKLHREKMKFSDRNLTPLLLVCRRSSLDFMSQFVEEFGGPHPGFAMIPARPPAGKPIYTYLHLLFAISCRGS